MQKCDICGNITDRNVRFNFMEIWKELHEWSDLPQIGVPCRDCIGLIRDKEAFRQRRARCEPMPHITGPEPWEDDAKGTVIAIFDSKIIGLRCAKIKYGVDAVSEMARGYKYQDEHGDTIVRITENDVPETERCGECGLSLWACNAMEVMI